MTEYLTSVHLIEKDDLSKVLSITQSTWLNRKPDPSVLSTVILQEKKLKANLAETTINDSEFSLG